MKIERESDAWKKNEDILMRYYNNKETSSELESATHWLQAQIHRCDKPNKKWTPEQKECIVKLAKCKYAIPDSMEYEEVRNVFIRVNSRYRHQVSSADKRMYTYVHILLKLDKLDIFTDTQKENLNLLDQSIEKHLRKISMDAKEILQVYTEVLKLLRKGNSLIDIKHQKKELYEKYREAPACHVRFQENEKKRYLKMKKEIEQANSKLRKENAPKRLSKAERMEQVYERVENYYENGGTYLYMDNSRLYIQYMQYQKQLAEAPANEYERIRKRQQHIEELKKRIK